MPSYISLTLTLVGATTAFAQSDIPLASRHFTWGDLPYMVDTNDGPRGIQTGYNICNSTTEGPISRCQTATVNSLDDFCIWGPQQPNSSIADTEGSLVAWCTKPGRGTRLIPAGALTGVQFMRTPDYVQVVGNINQSMINIAVGDSGGEEDPHGADGRGNPMGSIVFSNAFPSNNGNNNTFQQVIEWHLFLGGGKFCFKACDPAGPNATHFCEHIFDRIGCAYNAPAAYQDNVFESCQGDNQDFPGVFTGSDGQVSTFSQPPESLGPIASMPYQPKVPASSNCMTFSSNDLYAAVSTASGTASGAQSGATSGTATRTGSGATPTNTNGASMTGMGVVPRVGAVLAVVLVATVLA